MPEPRILIADDDQGLLSMMSALLDSKPWSVETACDGRTAADLLTEQRFDIAVLDFKMPHLDGLEVMEKIRQRGIGTDFIILTGFGTTELAIRALRAGARDFLLKPFRQLDLIERIDKLIDIRCSCPHVLATQLDAYVKTRASDPDLDLGNVLTHFGISMSYACRLFSEYLGDTFRGRRAYYRVNHAKHLLRASNLPMCGIAERSGFRNHQRLRDAFVRLEGISPLKYRRICRDSR